jgi:hypothetical protein
MFQHQKTPSSSRPPASVAENLSAESFPTPSLKQSFKFPNAPRGTIPDLETIPRFIGAENNLESLSLLKEVLSSMQKGARVGLPFDDTLAMSTNAKKILAQRGDSLAALRIAAEELGLSPITIERGDVRHSQKNQNLLTQIGRNIEALAGLPLNAIDRSLYESDNEYLRSRLESPKGCYNNQVECSSAWRSEMMAREIARIGGWSSQDVVIVSPLQALNLAKIFETNVSFVIGRYSSEEEMRSELHTTMAEQVNLHDNLLGRRMLHRLFFAIRHPIKAYRNRYGS